MEWLLLCLLVPAVVVPVVLLWGFAGCKFDPQLQILTPQNLVATPISVTEISLKWDNTDPNPVRFEVHRATDGTSFDLYATVDQEAFVDPTSDPTLPPLQPGITYSYKVIGVRKDNPDNRSSDSNIDAARPLAFVADLSVTQQIPIPPSEYTFVLRISPSRLHNSGTKVRVTVQGAPSGNVMLTRVFLSRAAPAGDPYDSLPAGNPGGLTQVGAAVPLTDDQAKPLTLPFIPYALDPSQDLLVAFDFTAAAGQANIRYDPSPGVALHFGQGFQEAGVADRAAGYVPQADPRSYLIKQIEVL
jgi:hypothetical protein